MHIPVRIVLVDTSHPGNIGATARAMKTMGLRDLALVRPRIFPSEEATARAAGADDLLAAAIVYETLAEAIADCGWVAGASARLRTVALPVVDPRECAATAWQRLAEGNRVALVLGPEQSGLTNEDLARCQQLVHIPTAPDFGSLNLAMAVQVLCYELRMAAQPSRADGPTSDSPLATAADLEGLHEHLERLLTESGFLHPEHQRQVKLKLRRIFHKATLDRNELAILRGMLTSLAPARRGPTPSS